MSAHKTALLSALTTALLASVSIQAAEPLKAVGAGEGQLDIVAWPGYIERGESDKAYDWSAVSRRKPAARSM
jgi:putative spermidine/putrescine transport system substrate-binding protein